MFPHLKISFPAAESCLYTFGAAPESSVRSVYVTFDSKVLAQRPQCKLCERLKGKRQPLL